MFIKSILTRFDKLRDRETVISLRLNGFGTCALSVELQGDKKWVGQDLHLRRPKPADLQSAAFVYFATHPLEILDFKFYILN